MTEEVKRNYLEISSLKDLKEGNRPTKDYSLNLIDPSEAEFGVIFVGSEEWKFELVH